MSRSQGIALWSGVAAAGLVLGLIFVGSGGFKRFDPPLAPYAAATIFSAFAIVYRYAMWLQRPPTWLYFKTSWKIFLRPKSLPRNVATLFGLLWSNIVAQRFIEKRSHRRWAAHLCLAWGCLLAFAITFPLSWGWVQFSAGTQDAYWVEVWGIRVFSFDPHGPIGFLMFNGLNFSAVLVLLGVGIAMHRRLFDRGAQAVQSFSSDLVPLFLLFAAAVTGLMLTASYKLMRGEHFAFISLLHAVSVVVLLLWLPFGKLFHVIQRPAQLGVAYYKQEAANGPRVVCPRSGEPFQSEMHFNDLSMVMRQVGISFGSHQALSPAEKRKLIALNQADQISGVPFVG